MATSASSLKKTSRTPSNLPEKQKEKTATTAAVKAAPNRDHKDPKAKPGALPDATLLDDEAGDGTDTAAAAPRGLAAWLPAGRKRWIALGGAAGGAVAMIAAAALAASHFHTAPVAVDTSVIIGPARALDGATMTVAGQTVHLDAIDAPAASFVCRRGAWTYRCGDAARRALDEAIGRAAVECVNAHPEAEGRVAALCRNDNGLDLAAIQVESGWAVNNIETSSRYVAEQARAEKANSGLWRNDFAHPELWGPTAR